MPLGPAAGGTAYDRTTVGGGTWRRIAISERGGSAVLKDWALTGWPHRHGQRHDQRTRKHRPTLSTGYGP